MANKDDKPNGCIAYDPAAKTAHFESAHDAWWFNIDHMDWRVTAESDKRKPPAAYNVLRTGLYCDPKRNEAAFSEFHSAWTFLQLHPHWLVTCYDVLPNELEPATYLTTAGSVLNLIEDMKEADNA